MEARVHKIDAAGKSVGRVATEIAVLLRGKHKPDFVPYRDEGEAVFVENAGKMRVLGNKMDQKKYYRHTGYLGGLKTESLKEVFAKDPGEVLRRAVRGMLPRTRLQVAQMKRLKIEA